MGRGHARPRVHARVVGLPRAGVVPPPLPPRRQGHRPGHPPPRRGPRRGAHLFEILVLGIGFAEISRSLAGWTAPAGSNPADGPLANLPDDTPFRRLEDT